MIVREESYQRMQERKERRKREQEEQTKIKTSGVRCDKDAGHKQRCRAAEQSVTYTKRVPDPFSTPSGY